MMQGHGALVAVKRIRRRHGSVDQRWKARLSNRSNEVPDAVPYLRESLGTTICIWRRWRTELIAIQEPSISFLRCNPGAHFEKQENSKLAIQYFQSYLEQKPDDLEVRWLLNLAYMTLGEYPAGVPAKYLIPQRPFRVEAETSDASRMWLRQRWLECLLRGGRSDCG